MKTLPLKGYKSLRALNAFHSLLIGLKFMPAYMHVTWNDWHKSFETKTDAEKETFIREAAAFVQLSQDEVDALVSFATDANGIPYSDVNMKNLTPVDLFEIIVAVCMEIGRIKIELVSEGEKKK